jgi:hypothetical protein
MRSPELAQYADFYADLTSRFAMTDSLALWRDFSERLHQLATEPEDAERDSIIAQATELKGWPPEIDDQVLEEDVGVARAAAVLAPLEPRTFGAIYEIRTYTCGTGFMPQVIERWAEKIAAAHALTVHRAPIRRPPAADTARAHLGLP